MIPKNSFRKIAVAAALAGDSKKASPVAVFDLAGKSPLADYAVLMEVESAPQLDAVEEEVQLKLKQEGVYCLHRDGMRSKNWKVLDYGGVLVHIYDARAAEFYSIAKVYEGSRPVDWKEKPAAPAVQAAKPAPAKKTAAGKPAAKKAPGRAVPKRTAKKTAPAKPGSASGGKAASKAKKAPAKKRVKKIIKRTVKRTAKKKWPSDAHSA